MKKSIFTRYISTLLIIILLSFSALTVIISSMTVRYANNQKKNIAIKTSEVIYNYLSSEKFYPSVTTLVNEFTKMINLLSHNAEKLSIIITDNSGAIRFATDDISGQITDEDILEIGQGDDMILTRSALNGIFPIDYTVIITPLVYSPSERAGIMLVCYNSHTVNELAVSTVRIIVIASLWVMILTLVAVYFITEKIVSPLRQMNAATKKFSSGQFNVRMNVKGEDEIAELAASFNKMAESLANIEYTRSSFLANVSHDLRTPMTTISGFIDGILDGAIPPEKQNYYLNIIAQEIRRLSRLVSQLLDISRMESGNRKFEKTNFDICEMARIILIAFEGKIEEKNLDV
ncbi:MAG: HAMP domain-containing histidine kinase, partial [Clostridiales bacterium]|nr:HAMP domain-containing histidine kinase [Clostridiales bacterium]